MPPKGGNPKLTHIYKIWSRVANLVAVVVKGEVGEFLAHAGGHRGVVLLVQHLTGKLSLCEWRSNGPPSLCDKFEYGVIMPLLGGLPGAREQPGLALRLDQMHSTSVGVLRPRKSKNRDLRFRGGGMAPCPPCIRAVYTDEI